jgi:flagellar basal-body rod protein FlgF
MLRGLYTATSGMIAQQRKHDALTNNIANAQTPGFKEDKTAFRSFPEMLISRIRDEGSQVGHNPVVGRLNTGMFAEENIPLFRQGDLQETMIPLDVALVDRENEAASFFVVRTAGEEERYTRNGRFSLDAAGQLVTAQGHLVLNEARQPIVLRDASEVQVGRDGQLTAVVSGERVGLGRMLVVRADNPQNMVREGHDLFRWEGEGEPVAGAAELRQGFLERSNVDPVETSVQMMSAARAYEANQKIIQFYDRSLDKAVNEVGRV